MNQKIFGRILRSTGLVVSILLFQLMSGCSAPASSPFSVPSAVPGVSVASSSSASSSVNANTVVRNGYKIAFSNSYIGNHWRAETVNIFNAYTARLVAEGVLARAYSSSSGNDSTAQINEIKSMIARGYDAIIVNAASPTALVPVLEQAADAGVVIVTFDNTIDSDKVYKVNTNQIEYGRMLARWLVSAIGGKGNILRINGIQGTTVSRDRGIGFESILRDFPDINVLARGDGKWDNATTANLINEMLSDFEGVSIDGILNEGGGESAIYEALLLHGLNPKRIPMTGEMTNGFLRHMVNDGVIGYAVGQPPYMSAAAVDVAIQVLSGLNVPKLTAIDIPSATSQQAREYYFPDQSDSFMVAYTNKSNTYGLEVGDIAPKN